MLRTVLFASAIAFGSSLVAHAEEMTLKQIYAAAVANIETIKLSQLQTSIAKEGLKRLESSFYPKASVLIDYTRIGDPGSTTTGTSAFSQVNQYDGRLSLTLNAIQGYREYFAHKVASLSIKAQEKLEENVKRLVLIDITVAYYNLQSARTEAANLELQLEAAKDRQNEIRRLIGIGRSPESDFPQQKTQLALTKAALVQAQGAILVAENALRVLAGLEGKVLIASEEIAMPQSLDSFELFLSSIDNRADVLSLKTQIEASKNSVSVAQADYWPSLSLKGNLHAFRSGVLSSSWWDAGLSLEIPIFDGFGTASAVRSADMAFRKSELALLQAKRVAHKEMRALYDEAQKIFASIPLLEEAYREALGYYNLVRKDYSLSLARNLDVIVALNQLYAVKRSYDQSINQFKLVYQTLLAASGRGL